MLNLCLKMTYILLGYLEVALHVLRKVARAVLREAG